MDNIFDDIKVNQSQLQRCCKLQQKAVEVGFKWDNIASAIEKCREELDEVAEAIKEGDSRHISEEIGDLLQTVVVLSDYAGLNPEEVLRQANDKFVKRFNYMESAMGEAGQSLPCDDLGTMVKYWQKAKQAGL